MKIEISKKEKEQRYQDLENLSPFVVLTILELRLVWGNGNEN